MHSTQEDWDMESMDTIRERLKAVDQWVEPVKHHNRTFVRYLPITVISLSLLLWVGPSWGGPPNPTPSDAQGNTAGGAYALENVMTGSSNTAFGFQALQHDTTGQLNTAVGNGALVSNTEGSQNTATGLNALYNNTTDTANTAVGFYALFSTTAGTANTAVGGHALNSTTTGNDNTAIGNGALNSTTTGTANTAVGVGSLSANTGSNNIALGNKAGSALTSGDNNIYLGNPGFASDSNTMRLGDNQSRTFINGIYGKNVGGIPVAIAPNGQLGAVESSASYKRDIQPMGAHSRRLLQLRPVIFRYKQDAQGERQYGLIAEEVAKVYPELVTRGVTGEVEAVRSHELIPMLLNEMQHQQRQLGSQAQQLTTQARQLAELQAQNARLRAAMEQQQNQNMALETRLESLEAAATRAGALASR
jgi:hypothetical protein